MAALLKMLNSLLFVGGFVGGGSAFDIFEISKASHLLKLNTGGGIDYCSATTMDSCHIDERRSLGQLGGRRNGESSFSRIPEAPSNFDQPQISKLVNLWIGNQCPVEGGSGGSGARQRHRRGSRRNPDTARWRSLRGKAAVGLREG